MFKPVSQQLHDVCPGALAVGEPGHGVPDQGEDGDGGRPHSRQHHVRPRPGRLGGGGGGAPDGGAHHRRVAPGTLDIN